MQQQLKLKADEIAAIQRKHQDALNKKQAEVNEKIRLLEEAKQQKNSQQDAEMSRTVAELRESN